MSLSVDPFVSVDPLVQSDRGNYFVATNPTPGTAIAFAVNAAVSETAGYFLSVQNLQAANGKRIYLDYLRLILATVPASATAGEMFVKLDTTGRTSGGTQCVPVNPNYDIAELRHVGRRCLGGSADLRGPLGCASGRAREAADGDPCRRRRVGLPLRRNEVGDASSTGGAVALRMPIVLPPVIIAPQSFALVQLWFPGNAATASQFEFELGMFER
jgi:hypothetical protein